MAASLRPRGPGAKGSPAPVTSASFLSRLGGAVVGGLTGGIGGAITGAITDPFGSGGRDMPAARPPVPSSFAGPAAPSGCRPPGILVAGRCVDPTAALPGGRPFVSGPGTAVVPAGGGMAVVGSFGIPALEPAVVPTPTRRCPPGAVLGKDNLCYMKGSIPRQFRKYPPRPKPVVSAHDAKMMRKYGPGGSKQARVKKLATEAGFSCKKR